MVPGVLLNFISDFAFAKICFCQKCPHQGCLLKLKEIPGSPGGGLSHPAGGPPVPTAGRNTGVPQSQRSPPPHPGRPGHPSGSVSLPNTPPSRPQAAPSPPLPGGKERHIFTCFLFSSLMILSFLPLNTFNGTEATTLSP